MKVTWKKDRSDGKTTKKKQAATGDLEEMRGYWELKEVALDSTV